MATYETTVSNIIFHDYNTSTLMSPEGGGALVFKGGYNARTRKQVKRVGFVFLTMQPMYARRAYIKKGCQKQQNLEKVYVFQPLKF